MKTLLAGCVPKLQSDGFVVDINSFGNKIYSHCGLLASSEVIKDQSVNDAGFADGLVAEHDYFLLCDLHV